MAKRKLIEKTNGNDDLEGRLRLLEKKLGAQDQEKQAKKALAKAKADERNRVRFENQARFDAAALPLLTKADAKASPGADWELLPPRDGVEIHYNSQLIRADTEIEALQEAVRTFGEKYELEVRAAATAEHDYNYESPPRLHVPAIGHYARRWLVFGRLRMSPANLTRCAQCRGAGLVDIEEQTGDSILPVIDFLEERGFAKAARCLKEKFKI